MLKKVSDYINSHNLIENGDRILVGVSGGADSVCLLHILSTLYQDSDVDFFVVHVHHGIRNEEADRDEAFVKSLCEGLKLPYCAYHFDVISLAGHEGLSEEEAGRRVRYKAFTDASDRFGCNKVAVAHNKNDNAETFLLNLFRGSAVKGLTGMDSIINMNTDAGSIVVIRPLLPITREEIEAYIKKNGLKYQEDSTNLSDIYTRNKIRNQVLGFVKEHINSNVIEHITNAAGHIEEAYSFIDKYINERYEAIVSDHDGFYEYDHRNLRKEDIVIRKGIVRKILGNLAGSLKDIESKHVDNVLSLGKMQVGKMINLPYGMIAQKEYDRVSIYIPLEGEKKHLHREPGEFRNISSRKNRT